MAAGKTTKDVVFTAKMRDATGPGFESIKRKSKAAAVQMANTTGALVSDKTGRAMSQFNERTEKMRQLVLLSSSSMGNLAGSMVYYGGTLSYVLGIFKPWQIALLAVAVAVGWLGKVLLEESEHAKAWRKELKKTKEEVKGLGESVTGFLESQKRMRAGWTAEEGHLAKVQDEIVGVRQQLRRIDFEIKEYWTKNWKDAAKQFVPEDIRKRGEAFQAELSRLRAWETDLINADHKTRLIAINKTEKEMKEKAAEAAKRRAVERRKEMEQFAAFQRAKVAAFVKGLKAMLDAERQAEVDRTARIVRINQALAQHEAGKERRIVEGADAATARRQKELDVEAYWEDRKYVVADQAARKKLEMEKAAAEQRMEYAAMGADAMISLFGAIATGSAQQVADTLKAMAFEALARAAWHGIMAVASALLGGGLHTGQHATMAALYAGFAATYGAGALAASGMAGGGGGGGGAIGGGGYDISQRAGYQERGEEDQKTYAVFYVYGHQFFGNDVRGDRDLNDRVVRYKESQNPGRESDRF